MDIVGRRNWFFGLSLLIIIPGIVSMVVRGFSLGIDFSGGSETTLAFKHATTTNQVQTAAARIVPGAVVQAVQGQTNTFIIRTAPLTPRQLTDLTGGNYDAQGQPATASDAGVLPPQFGGLATKVDPQDPKKQDPIRSVSTVGPTIAQEAITRAIVAVAAAALLIVAYLWFRFGLAFGVAAIVALLHDVFVLTGVFSILGRVFNLPEAQIDTLFVTAALTVVGFSVHDTIVIFDRIRENLRTSSRLTFPQTVNLSIIQSMARSLNTSMTVLLVLLALFLFGGETIKGFALALLVGILSGTYSSIFNASPLLVVWRGLQRA
jgi:preprotein translocase subunit SecF